ncbi:unnamed protein product [Musa textilis]
MQCESFNEGGGISVRSTHNSNSTSIFNVTLVARIMSKPLLPTLNLFRVSLSSKFLFFITSKCSHLEHEGREGVWRLLNLFCNKACSFFSKLNFLLIVLHSSNNS